MPNKAIPAVRQPRLLHGGQKRLGLRFNRLCKQPALGTGVRGSSISSGFRKGRMVVFHRHRISLLRGSGRLSPASIRRLSHPAITNFGRSSAAGRSGVSGEAGSLARKVVHLPDIGLKQMASRWTCHMNDISVIEGFININELAGISKIGSYLRRLRRIIATFPFPRGYAQSYPQISETHALPNRGHDL